MLRRVSNPRPLPPVPLTPTSHLVLGLVAWRGPLTPYELKALVARTVGHFWSFPHTQLYTEPVRLAGAGLLHEQREQGGRRRRRFSITEDGREALEQWLRVPSTESSEIRDLALLQLFFAGLGQAEDARALAAAQEQAHRERLSVYEQTEERIAAARAQQGESSDPGESELARRCRSATLRMGFIYERAAVAFWKEVGREVAEPGIEQDPGPRPRS